MTDTKTPSPSDAEIVALLGDPKYSTIGAVREAVARWGQPMAVAGGELVACGNCGGSGRMVRDPDIGTDQECFACEGSGSYSDAAPPPQAVREPQPMPDLTQLTERGAEAWAGVDAQGLREGFTAADMATASAQGFRDGVASVAASAGSEPVAWRYVPSKVWGDKVFTDDPVRADDARQAGCVVEPLYLHPSPPEGMVGGWIALPGTLPEPGVPVLLDIGKKYPIRAMWAAKHTVPAAGDDTDWGEYDEATDQYWCPEGWYEWNEHEDTNWAVSATPRAWATLPPTTPAGSGKGE